MRGLRIVKILLCTSWEIFSLKVLSNISKFNRTWQFKKRKLKTNSIHFPFDFTRTTLFPQPFDNSLSSRRLGLRSFFLGSNLLLHFDVTLNGTKSRTSRQFIFRNGQQTRCYTCTGSKIRYWYDISGNLGLGVVLRQNVLYCESLCDVCANFCRW